ncbi:MAG: transcriptional regulator FilR1 domain-containing protein [Methanolobus sp.]|nr:transcriptional regulator FilR1 domain-containing protein [Methanolobus sp.]
MKRNLLSTIFTSYLVKDILLLLNDGPKDTGTIMSTLRTSRQALFPQIRILSDSNIISMIDGPCRLTAMGTVLVDKIVPLLDMFDLLENIGCYELDFIPQHLLKRISELGPCTVVDPPIPEICEVDKEFQRLSTESRSIAVITSFMFPNFSDIFAAYIEKGVPVSVIVSAKLHDKLKCNSYQEYKNLIDNEIIDVYVHNDEMGLVSFTQNDHGIMLRLLSNTDHSHYDYKRVLFQSPLSLQWGRDLFDHYKSESVRVADI